MNKEIASPAKCSACGKVFYGPAVGLGGVLKAGEMVAPRLMKFLDELFRHCAEAHPERFQVAQVKGTELQGWYVLSLYETNDREVLEQRDFFRWRTHQGTLSATAQNLDVRAREVAAEIFEEIGVEDFETTGKVEVIRELVAGKIQDVLEELREILEEPGKYKPQTPEQQQNGSLVRV